MREHPKAIGDRTTLAVMLALNEQGLNVAVPFGENTRYDLLVDDGTRIRRIQCKTGRLRGGAVRFKTASSYAHHPNPKPTQRHYVGQVDTFAVYCPETGGVYLVPIDVLPINQAHLRVTLPRNGQRKRVRLAADYEVATIALGSTERTGGSRSPCEA